MNTMHIHDHVCPQRLCAQSKRDWGPRFATPAAPPNPQFYSTQVLSLPNCMDCKTVVLFNGFLPWF